jgi:hypothetical protein
VTGISLKWRETKLPVCLSLAVRSHVFIVQSELTHATSRTERRHLTRSQGWTAVCSGHRGFHDSSIGTV